jgi:hypothetical protein
MNPQKVLGCVLGGRIVFQPLPVAPQPRLAVIYDSAPGFPHSHVAPVADPARRLGRLGCVPADDVVHLRGDDPEVPLDVGVSELRVVCHGLGVALDLAGLFLGYPDLRCLELDHQLLASPADQNSQDPPPGGRS